MADTTIPVVIQTPDERVPFTDWETTDLDDAIRTVRRWGLVDADGDYLNADDSTGEFAIVDGRVVFRVTVEGYPA